MASFFAGQYFRNPRNLKFKILLVFIMYVEVRSQFFKSEWVSGNLWLCSYGMTLYDSCVSECLILGACNCNAKMCRLVWAGYIVAGQATLYHRYVIILLLVYYYYSTKIVTSVLWPLPYGSYANIVH